MPPLLIDVSHTSHTRARTGIQRVVRSLVTALGKERAQCVTFDPYADSWRALDPWETANLRATAPSAKRGARWPLGAKLRGYSRRGSSHSNSSLPADSAGILVPELFSAAVGAKLPGLFAATTGPRLAIFHDAIALKLPEMTPTKTVARLPAYLRELLAFDGIATVSEDSQAALLDYWQWLGISTTPPVRTIPLGVDLPSNSAGDVAPLSSPVVLSVGSIEGRKNHVALLEACEQLWSRSIRFKLRLIGLAQPQTGKAALQRIAELQAAGRPLQYNGPADDAALNDAYQECAFTVYPSLMEGFGLPVLESVAHGKPCICSGRGALGESARSGGCVALDVVDAPALARAIARLLATPLELAQLTQAARTRKLRTWSDYAAEIFTWSTTLRRR